MSVVLIYSRLLKKLKIELRYLFLKIVKSWLNEIFRDAVAKGVIEINPTADLAIATFPYRRNNHYPYLKMQDIP